MASGMERSHRGFAGTCRSSAPGGQRAAGRRRERVRAGGVGQDVDPPRDAPVAPPGRLCVRLDAGARGGGSGPAEGLRLDAGGGRGRGDLDDLAAGVAARADEGRGELVDGGRRTSGPARRRRGRGGRPPVDALDGALPCSWSSARVADRAGRRRPAVNLIPFYGTTRSRPAAVVDLRRRRGPFGAP